MFLTSFVTEKSKSPLWVILSFIAYPVVLGGIMFISSKDANLFEAGPPDLELGLSPDQLYKRLDYYGGHGREIYLYCEAFDSLVYSVTYMLAFRIIGCAAYRWVGLPLSINYLVVLAWIVDQIENLCFIFLTVHFHRYHTWDTVATIASIATQTKWVLFSLFLGTLILAVLIRITRIGKAKPQHVKKETKKEVKKTK